MWMIWGGIAGSPMNSTGATFHSGEKILRGGRVVVAVWLWLLVMLTLKPFWRLTCVPCIRLTYQGNWDTWFCQHAFKALIPDFS
ncbi:hypothetical protein [[Phormidium] sp. ETS-05]|uniref:hypothetical protein n=1 Tax=[Phormidium] sp. ETS-05 TaxID=222819 RepID=UPI0018EF18F7|nr:hypothetical protein [[Phormidium] sp. ETS-05]